MNTPATKISDISRDFHVIDAQGVALGRLASEVARLLIGKSKPYYVPYLDCGDHVIVVNASKVEMSKSKLSEEKLYWHSQYPGGLKSKTYIELRESDPDKLIRKVVWGMLPKGRLGRKMLKKLHVYSGPDHPHSAQKPKFYESNSLKKVV